MSPDFWIFIRPIGDTSRIAHTLGGTEIAFVSITHTGIVHTKTVENTKTLEFQRLLTSYWNCPHKKTAENSQNKKKTHLHTLFTKNMNVTKM